MEGKLHKELKKRVANELQKLNYDIFFEPDESQLSQLSWHSYRPDILALISNKTKLEIIIVECETNPNRNRLLRKTNQLKTCLSIQKLLNDNLVFNPLLVIPSGNLQKLIGSSIRNIWEIWIVNRSGKIQYKIPQNKLSMII